MSLRSYRFNRLLLLLLLVWVCAPFAPPHHRVAAEEAPPAFIRQVRELETARLGIANPAGLIFSRKARLFQVIRGRAGAQPAPETTDLLSLTPLDARAGSMRIAAKIDDPINVTFDDKRQRLLIYRAAPQQLLEVTAGANGLPNPKNIRRYKLKALDLQNPQGMSVAPQSGDLYILDAAGPRLVRVPPAADGSFDNAAATIIDLRATGINTPRGLAWEPSGELLYIVSVTSQTLYSVTADGQIVATRDLTSFGLRNPQALVFAPSGDLTDDPEEMSLYIADAGLMPSRRSRDGSDAAPPCPTPEACPNQIYLPLVANDETAVALDTDALDTGAIDTGAIDTKEIDIDVERSAALISADPANPGTIIELSLSLPSGPSEPTFASGVVRTTDLAAIAPPSPDPSGLTYVAASNKLVMSDGEIEEIVAGITHFQGANVWELTLGGSIIRTANLSLLPPTVTPMTNEPTGVAWNPNNGHYFFSDDDTRRIYTLNPGADGLVGTTDDTWTSFATLPAGSADPEGLAFDPVNNHLFVADGLNMEIYQFTTSGTLLNQFDVEQYGVLDPEGVEFITESGTLVILSNGVANTIIETTIDGLLLRTMNLSAADTENPAALVYAPASDGSGARRYYVADRGVDNNSDPTLIDGKIYEMTAPDPLPPGFNTPPLVNAGADQAVVLPNSIQLDGTVSDDGQPNPPGTVVTEWTQISGPGTATFGNPNAVDTTASFTLPGLYVLRLSAFDGAMLNGDNVTINVTGSSNIIAIDQRIIDGSNDAEENINNSVSITSADLDMMLDPGSVTPINNLMIGLRFPNLAIPVGAVIVNARIQFEADEAYVESTQFTIQGEAVDSAAPFAAVKRNLTDRPRTTTAVAWSPPAWTIVGEAGPHQRTPSLTAIVQELVSRPGWVSGNAMAFLITGSGQRIARSLEGRPSGAALLHIEYTTNQAPQVNAGPDQTITLSTNATLNGTVGDDGLPAPPNLITAWSQVSGPGTVTFGNVNAVDTTAAFPTVGVYVLRLTANDGALSAFDEITITVSENQAPVVSAGADQVIPAGNQAILDGAASDDGVPPPPALVTTWSQVSGPPGVVFGNVNVVDTTATFPSTGVYLLRLTANDGLLSTFDEVTITVNTPPLVNAGPDQSLALPNQAALDGTVSDDGLPLPPSLTTAWSQVSGPGTVTFGNVNAVDTTAAFSAPGSYILRLSATDGAWGSNDDVQITVTDLIFADGFESGNLSAWSSSVTGGGDLSVSPAAALAGAQGLQALINDNFAIYVVDDAPTAEPRYRVRFYFDPNTIPMAANDSHQIFSGRTEAGTVVLQIEFRFSGGVYQVRALILDDGTSATSSGWFTISDAPHALEVDWRAATAAGANNGGLTFWIDGVQRANVTGIDNDTRRIDLIRLGAGSGIDNGTRGTYYFDAYEARRQSYIGP
ncbi:MAG: hypothetical protein DYG89_28505 [Caldilinea sp. CFX5]|nr:hypothetical protein [Caldilinea sp. CFX5]